MQSTPGENLLVQQNQILIQENQAKTMEGRSYYNAWISEKAARENLEKLVAELQQQMNGLQLQLNRNTEPNIQIQESAFEYETDEEELAKETEWIVQESRRAKRKKMNTTPDRTPNQQIPGSSRDNAKDYKEVPKKIPAPPPIMVSKIKNYNDFQNELKEQGIKNQVTMMNNDQLKINVEDGETYRKITNHLRNRYEWHSYEDKRDRPLKVMARRLHPTCEPKIIVKELQERGFKSVDAVNILKRKDKTPLPLFMLTFENKEDPKKVFEITEILLLLLLLQPGFIQCRI
jgi:Associated with zinc fingers